MLPNPFQNRNNFVIKCLLLKKWFHRQLLNPLKDIHRGLLINNTSPWSMLIQKNLEEISIVLFVSGLIKPGKELAL